MIESHSPVILTGGRRSDRSRRICSCFAVLTHHRKGCPVQALLGRDSTAPTIHCHLERPKFAEANEGSRKICSCFAVLTHHRQGCPVQALLGRDSTALTLHCHLERPKFAEANEGSRKICSCFWPRVQTCQGVRANICCKPLILQRLAAMRSLPIIYPHCAILVSQFG